MEERQNMFKNRRISPVTACMLNNTGVTLDKKVGQTKKGQHETEDSSFCFNEKKKKKKNILSFGLHITKHITCGVKDLSTYIHVKLY